jgi:Holliday junction resolvase
MSGKRSRDKGARMEREIVRLLQDKGRAAERIPLSGAMGGRYGGDVSVPVLGDDWRIEAKCRADGFKEIYRWLEGNDALVIKADRKAPLIVLDLAKAADVLAKVEAVQLSPDRISIKRRAAA